jgi:hypothetical protein
MPLDNMTCCANFKRILSGEWSNPKTDLNYFASLVISFLSSKVDSHKDAQKVKNHIFRILNFVSSAAALEETTSFSQKSTGQISLN